MTSAHIVLASLTIKICFRNNFQYDHMRTSCSSFSWLLFQPSLKINWFIKLTYLLHGIRYYDLLSRIDLPVMWYIVPTSGQETVTVHLHPQNALDCPNSNPLCLCHIDAKIFGIWIFGFIYFRKNEFYIKWTQLPCTPWTHS